MIEIKAKIENPLSELISDDIYEILNSHNLIDEKSARNFQIRNKFKKLRATKVGTDDAIDILVKYYPYLQFDTIKKIVYQSIVPKVKQE